MSRYIFPIFLVLLALSIAQFYIRPLYAEIQHQLIKETEVRTALTEADTARTQLDKIAKSYASFPADANEKLDEIFPEKIDPIRLLIDTTAFFEHNGFPAKRLSISSDAGESGAPYQMHRISFSISASYDTFREFLHILEASLVLRDLSGLSFSAGSSSVSNVGVNPESAIHEYNIQITGYSLR